MINGLIEDWALLNNRIYGIVYNCKQLKDGMDIITSTLVTPQKYLKIGTIIQTQNSYYILGKPLR